MRSIRFYHQAGLLQRPRVVGRVGWYGQEHLDRLGLVRRLQARGYSLAAIADSIAAQVPAVVLGEVGEGDTATAVWDGAERATLDRDQLAAMVPQLGEQPALLARMVDLGLLVPDDGGEGDGAAARYAVPHPPLLRAGIILVARGVPVPVALGELEDLRRDLDVIAERFAVIVERDMLPARQAAGGAAAELATDLLGHVWPAVLVAVGQVLTDATHRAVAARLVRRAEES